MNPSPWCLRAATRISGSTVDQKLSQLIRSDAFRGLYSRWFGEFDQSTARFFRDTVLPD